jgi:hypothetical protein
MQNLACPSFLGRKYDKSHTLLLDRGGPRDAAKAPDVNFPGSAKDLVEAEAKVLRFAVFKMARISARENWIPAEHVY